VLPDKINFYVEIYVLKNFLHFKVLKNVSFYQMDLRIFF
jgi:hypothetical protein